MKRRRIRLMGMAVGAIVALAMLGAVPAQATFPGPNGRIAFTDFATGGLYAVDPDGTDRRLLSQAVNDHGSADPNWSASGDRIVFDRFRTDTDFLHDHSRIWIMNADGSNEHQVAGVRKPFRDVQPTFTPDGGQIVFSRCARGEFCAIWKMNADGSDPQPLTPFVMPPGNESIDQQAAVSPDGSQIAFSRFADGGIASRVIVMNADGTDPHAITPPALEGFAPDWSPDGSRVAFATNANRTGSRIYTVAPDGSDVQSVTPSGYPQNDVNPSYAPRGNRFVFASDRFPDLCCFGMFTTDVDGGSTRWLDVGLFAPFFIFDPAWGSAPRLP